MLHWFARGSTSSSARLARALAEPVSSHAGTPQELVDRINSELNRALSAPDVQERLGQLGLDWKSNTSGQFAAFLREEVQKWAKAVKDSGAKAD